MRKFNDLEVLGGLVIGLREVQRRGLLDAYGLALVEELRLVVEAAGRRERARRGGLASGRRRNRSRPEASGKEVVREQLLDGHEGP